jgi:hypothetical protein
MDGGVEDMTSWVVTGVGVPFLNDQCAAFDGEAGAVASENEGASSAATLFALECFGRLGYIACAGLAPLSTSALLR